MNHHNHLLSRISLFTCLQGTTSVENPLQIDLFMQNKPNVKNAQINVSSLITMNYKNFIPLAGYKNKPNSNLALSAVEWANSNPIPKKPK